MAFKCEHSLFVYLLRILFVKPEINSQDVFAEPPVSHSTDCQPWWWTHTIVCAMTILTDKVTHCQVLNQWAYCLKIMVTHRIYINDRDIWKHLPFLNATSRPLCIHSKFECWHFSIKTNQHFISELEISELEIHYILGWNIYHLLNYAVALLLYIVFQQKNIYFAAQLLRKPFTVISYFFHCRSRPPCPIFRS